MQGLIVGFGSIGKKHAQILKNLGCNICLVTSQKIKDYVCYSTIENALEKESIDYVIIANQTNLHYQVLMCLIQCHYQGIVLVEKPLFSKVEDLPKNNLESVFVAYNLRFHELLIQAKRMIKNEKLITFSAYVGQYLPAWRKGIDYRQCYSAKQEQGGGVLRDLSHELDYSLWLCGPCLSLAAMGGHFSTLEINSEDTYSIIMQCVLCPVVSLHLNYLDKSVRREVIINTEKNTILIDFIKGTINVDGETQFRHSEDMMHTYFRQHQAVINGDFSSFCNLTEGISVMKVIEAAEKAVATKAWINL
ncbi:MAG TPA: Gfo/Idh/MocA family oxidoreductase [Gammaproteobacteria bacterium]|nr:Gfo/Idh/MocA family oxidoreductase [Gammaproteobacteria bacterium]